MTLERDVYFAGLEAERDRLREINAELVAALQDCRGWLAAFAKGAGTHKEVMESERMAKINAAIAKVQP